MGRRSAGSERIQRPPKRLSLKRKIVRSLKAVRRKVLRKGRNKVRRKVRRWAAFVGSPSKRALLKKKILKAFIVYREEQARLPAILRWVWVRRIDRKSVV